MLKCLKIIALFFHLAFLFDHAYASQTNEEFNRTNEEWPEFDKQQLKELAQGRAAYEKNPVTDKDELFIVEKDSQTTQSFRAFKADIENVEAGDLKPDLDIKNRTTNLYNSKYGKIKILVRPATPSSDPSDTIVMTSPKEETANEETTLENNDPNDVSTLDDNIREPY